MRRWALLVLMLVCALIGTEPTASARGLDPGAAERDAQGIFHDGYTFCSKPRQPLSIRARELCPLAHQAVGCEALVAACEARVEPKEPSPFWIRLGLFLASIAPYVAWAVAGALLVVLLYVAFRAIRAAKEDALAPPTKGDDVVALQDDVFEEDTTAANLLLQRAAALSSRGELRAALFTYLAAALRALDNRGALRVARDRTHGEYVRTCREAGARPALRGIVRDVDIVQFGGGSATADAVERAAVRAEAIVHAAPPSPPVALATLTMLLVLSLVGCSGAFGTHDDPEGRDLLADLLTKQGAHVSGLPGSLASLPMNGSVGPAVIVDVDRVPLEDETKAHLAAWVKQGGTLILAGNARLWPGDFWAKPTLATGTEVRVETRARSLAAPRDPDESDERAPSPIRIDRAVLADPAAITWPNEDRAPRAIAHLAEGELYAALRSFGEGKVLGLASGELFTNLGLVVPGNAAAVIALLGACDKTDFIIVRTGQGISPPSNPFAGLLRIGLGLALAHALVFIPLVFLAFGVRQVRPKEEPPETRRAFAEHVRAVGALYARRRGAEHALMVFAKHVDDRVRAKMPRGYDPVQFLAARSGEDPAEVLEIYTRAMSASTTAAVRGDELRLLDRLSQLYARAMADKL